MKFKQICILYSDLYKKKAFDISKKNSYTKFLCDLETDNVTYFLISSKNLRALYLSFQWFNDSRTRGFELVTREFELVTREFELVTQGFELVTRGFELVTCGFKLALLNCNSCF